ncbi:hypothetical protein JL722_4764 [Aureococcus anophagefferens]|nr:hypothetical protein JL722_4764 [Aureococcus anophagefferens]
MLMSRQPGRMRGGRNNKTQPESKSAKLTRLDEYIKKRGAGVGDAAGPGRDYTGALALLEFNRKGADAQEQQDALLWIGYCACHLGNYQRAYDAYSEILTGAVQASNSQQRKLEAEGKDGEAKAAGGEAKSQAEFFEIPPRDPAGGQRRGRPGRGLAQRRRRREARVDRELRLEDTSKRAPERALRNRLLFHIAHKRDDQDKLMMRHQDLTDTNEDQLSLAAIHYLRSHFQEATDIYKRLLLENRDDLALNVYVAMCYYKLDYYDVSLEILAAAEAELKVLADQGHALQANDLIRHNRVVFSQGEGALQVLPALGDFIPEARLNLVIYYLRHDGMQEAHELIKDVEPSTPQEYILKGVVNASCMASCFFLLKQFEDVNIYLNSIKAYMYNDDDFNWNHGISLAQTGNYKAAEEALLLVQNERYKTEYCYISWLARCYIMNAQPKNAWELYLKMDTSNESFNLLQLIANDCYRMGQFLYAAKAFDVLERLDPDPEFWEGKRGACVGVFQQVVAGKAAKEDLRDVLAMVRNTSNPQVEYMVRVISKWAASSGIKIS